MRLSEAELEEFGDRGFLVLENLFSAAEVAVLRAALPAILADDCAANIREKGSGEVRTAMGLHRPLGPPSAAADAGDADRRR